MYSKMIAPVVGSLFFLFSRTTIDNNTSDIVQKSSPISKNVTIERKTDLTIGQKAQVTITTSLNSQGKQAIDLGEIQLYFDVWQKFLTGSQTYKNQELYEGFWCVLWDNMDYRYILSNHSGATIKNFIATSWTGIIDVNLYGGRRGNSQTLSPVKKLLSEYLMDSRELSKMGIVDKTTSGFFVPPSWPIGAFVFAPYHIDYIRDNSGNIKGLGFFYCITQDDSICTLNYQVEGLSSDKHDIVILSTVIGEDIDNPTGLDDLSFAALKHSIDNYLQAVPEKDKDMQFMRQLIIDGTGLLLTTSTNKISSWE